jgi:hypothetical protein
LAPRLLRQVAVTLRSFCSLWTAAPILGERRINPSSRRSQHGRNETCYGGLSAGHMAWREPNFRLLPA